MKTNERKVAILSETVASSWVTFAERVIPADAPAIQVSEMRRAFYAGAAAMLAMTTACGDDAVDEASALNKLSALLAELDAFGKDVLAGRA